MKKLIVFLLTLQLALPVIAQQNPAPPRQPAPGKIFVQTPFGMVEVDAPGTPVPPNPAPTTVTPAAPVATPALPPVPGAVPAEAQPAPVPGQTLQADDAAPIALNFQTPTDITNIIKIILDALKVNYIIDPAVKGSINVVAENNLKRSDLLPILETILKINNATMVKIGNFYQITPAGTVARQPLQVQERAALLNPDDQMVLQILRMKFVGASEMAALLNPYLSEGANIVVQATGNILLITERRSNLRKLLEIVDIFDTNAFQDERVRLFPVKNNLARDLVTDLNAVFAGYGMSQSSAIRFLPIERLNSILAISPNVNVFPDIEKWVTRLDENTLRTGIRTYVYPVKNAKAADIQLVLTQLYGGQQTQFSTIYNQPGAAPLNTAPGTVPAAAALANAPASAASQSSTLPGRLSDVKIIADILNNFLVIQATPQIYEDIKRTIEELDILRRQVLIDAQIFEVVLDHSMTLGITATLQNRVPGVERSTTAQFVGAPPAFSAQTFALVGRTRELLLFLNASENRSKVRTLSAPSVMVTDNMTADFQVGAEVPIPTSSSVTPVQSGGTNLFAQTISFRPTGVILQVKPQINDGGNVTLDISQEVSQASANTTSAVVAPVIGKSSVKSSIVVQDGQTIAIGGFIRENNDVSSARLPLLGRIPGVGALFGNTQRSAGRTELIILITPHVLRTHDDADVATDELKTKLKEVQKLLK